MRGMRRIMALLLLIGLLPLLGCAKEPEAVVIDVTGASAAASAAPASAGARSAPAQSAAPAEGAGLGPRAEVRQTVAYALSCAEGPALYGAASYENTGDAPLRLTGASFTFTFSGQAEAVDFVPIFAEETIVLPGETAYAALWYTLPSLAPGTPVRLSASLQYEEAPASRVAVQAQDIRLAHNYPAFTTMAGVLTAGADCPCNLVYTGFYDEGGALLGVWYFTDNAQLIAGTPKAFTTHMKELPIDGLAEQTAEVRSFGIGIP